MIRAVLLKKPNTTFTQFGRIGGGMFSLRHRVHLRSVLLSGKPGAVQGIGNLTLVSKKLNPSLSNGPWSDLDADKPGKRSGLHAHTMLMINRKLLDDHNDNWSDKAIGARAEQMFSDAKDIWPC
ncbi:HNH endonuclease family protein [Lentibacter sp. XHP0401]|uniref:HNH endonuclease family protein n=1 Tax=Lentibacter sp. XHP0401 TaxID=2984334 RepID=UPI0039964D68